MMKPIKGIPITGNHTDHTVVGRSHILDGWFVALEDSTPVCAIDGIDDTAKCRS